MNNTQKLKEFAAVVQERATGRNVAVTAAVLLSGVAGAQNTAPTSGLNFSQWVSSLQGTAIGIINEAGPALFALMAIIGGVYFVWNRVRSLW